MNAMSARTLPTTSSRFATDSPRLNARLLSLGVAVPQIVCSQTDAATRLATAWNLRGASLNRWRRINAASGIDRRHGVLDIEDVLHLTTSARMNLYEQHAPPLAANAARLAMENARVSPQQITDLIVVSCTGFSAPGVDVALVELLGLQPTVRRCVIGFMGCFGAISGLRAAVGAVAANANCDPPPVALVVCVELCSLHFRADASPQNMVASALFADGAAAAVVAMPTARVGDSMNSSISGFGTLASGSSLLLPQGREWMTWRVTDSGFAMTLAREVPAALRECLRDFVADACDEQPRTFIVHPGGPGILDAAESAIGCGGCAGIDASRQVLRRFGNMSSATILFVLEEAMRRDAQLPALLLAFGPGLTIESMPLMC